MRGRLCLIGVGVLVLSGCAEEVAAPPASLPAPKVVRLPASSAGGACELLDYSTIEAATGTVFDVSAKSGSGKTNSCVVRTEAADHPELALSVTPTAADAAIFADEMVPSGGKAVKGLGKAAYQATTAPVKSTGASAEIGWLSGNGRLINLRYTLQAGQDRAAAEALATKLIALAKQVDAVRP